MKHIISIFVSLVLCLSLLCGCDIFTADTAELLNPPELSGEYQPISEAIKKSSGGEYTLKYPSRGEYRSAVVQNDINGDGIAEVFAFYSTAENDVETMYIEVITGMDGEWKTTAQQKIVAGGVDKVEFCDLDADGRDEILVGWEIYGTSEMQLAVYSFNNNVLVQRMLQKYNQFICTDLDDDDVNEVFLVKLNPAEQQNFASAYILTDDGFSEIYNCRLDPTVKTVNEPVQSYLSSGKTAVYIDEIKGVGAVTEVLFTEKNQLINPLLDAERFETTATLRTAAVNSYDINGDGIIEIPVQREVPAINQAIVNERLYLTDWCTFNGEMLTSQFTAMTNVNDGYYYIIPAKWQGQIAVLKDTENNIREIYKYNSAEKKAGEKLLQLRSVKKSSYDSGKYKNTAYNELCQDGINVYLCEITEAAEADGLTLKDVKQNFKLIEQA